MLDLQISLLENKLQLIESFFEIFKINFFKKFETNEKLILFNEFILANKNRNKSNLNYDVITVSNKYGFIKQEQYFSQKKLVASKNKQNYYILENKYFGFNPSRINVGSFGYWNLNEKVLISPIYESFKLNNNFYLDEIFFDYVKSKYFKKQLTKYESGSVRKGIKMDDLKMFAIFKISLISQKEYIDKRALILSQMNFLRKKINLLKLKKEYFLKKMFV